MQRKTPGDYDSSDGIGDGAIDQCPHCGQSLHPEDHIGTVYDSDGNSYDIITDTDPSDRPFFCSDCWDELDANRRAQENKSITEWSQ